MIIDFPDFLMELKNRSSQQHLLELNWAYAISRSPNKPQLFLSYIVDICAKNDSICVYKIDSSKKWNFFHLLRIQCNFFFSIIPHFPQSLCENSSGVRNIQRKNWEKNINYELTIRKLRTLNLSRKMMKQTVSAII